MSARIAACWCSDSSMEFDFSKNQNILKHKETTLQDLILVSFFFFLCCNELISVLESENRRDKGVHELAPVCNSGAGWNRSIEIYAILTIKSTRRAIYTLHESV